MLAMMDYTSAPAVSSGSWGIPLAGGKGSMKLGGWAWICSAPVADRPNPRPRCINRLSATRAGLLSAQRLPGSKRQKQEPGTGLGNDASRTRRSSGLANGRRPASAGPTRRNGRRSPLGSRPGTRNATRTTLTFVTGWLPHSRNGDVRTRRNTWSRPAVIAPGQQGSTYGRLPIGTFVGCGRVSGRSASTAGSGSHWDGSMSSRSAVGADMQSATSSCPAPNATRQNALGSWWSGSGTRGKEGDS